MMHTPPYRKTRIYLTLVVAASHFALALLGVTDRLTYSVAPGYVFLEETLSNGLWVLFHGLCFAGVTIAVVSNKGHVYALGAATGVMSAWAFLSLLWGLSSPAGPSLSGPVLAGGIATLAYILTASWAKVPRHQEGIV